MNKVYLVIYRNEQDEDPTLAIKVHSNLDSAINNAMTLVHHIQDNLRDTDDLVTLEEFKENQMTYTNEETGDEILIEAQDLLKDAQYISPEESRVLIRSAIFGDDDAFC